jgi:hypothetical protein
MLVRTRDAANRDDRHPEPISEAQAQSAADGQHSKIAGSDFIVPPGGAPRARRPGEEALSDRGGPTYNRAYVTELPATSGPRESS